MKYALVILSIIFSFELLAQENAIDYIIPQVNNHKVLYLSSSDVLEGDITTIQTEFQSQEFKYFSEFNADGSTLYKFVHYEGSLFSREQYAYFLKFNGNSAQLFGYSDYKLKNNLFFDDVVNEDYSALNNQTIYKVPNESYQSQNWSFQDPNTQKQVNGSSYYKTMNIGDYERKILVVEFTSGSKTRKEYYLKYYGLIAIQEPDRKFYINDFDNFSLYTKSFLDDKGEYKTRTYAWDLIEHFRDVNIGDSFFNLDGKNKRVFEKSKDSILGLFEHMMLRNPELQNPYKYMLSIVLYSGSIRIFDEAESQKVTAYQYETIIDELYHYYFIRPYPDAISQYNLSTYVTNISESFYQNFWKMDYCFLKTLPLKNSFERSYKAYLCKPRVESILKFESNIDNVNKCILFAYVSDYYKLLEDEGNEYFYLVKSVEYYKYLSTADKDLNIDYMRAVMRDLAELKPKDEDVLNRAIAATNDLKDYSNSVRIAENGISHKLGIGINFALLYAEAAFQDDLNKPSLRKAMDILSPNLNLLSLAQLNDYLKYCRALGSEYDCKKAESLLSKAKKKEQSEARKNSNGSNKSYGSNNRSVNLALLFNPFAGANITGNGGFLKFLPMSAELRTGKIVHEFRYNMFFGGDFKNRFVGGKLDNEADVNNKWKNLHGADYSYGIIFVKNDKGYNGQECTSGGGGLQFLYGAFQSDKETTNVTINGAYGTINVTPNIKRYEAILNFKYIYFDWKSHFSATMFYGFGLGMREITYNNSVFSESTLKDKDKTVFEDQRFTQKNWEGAYFTLRLGFRIGFTIF